MINCQFVPVDPEAFTNRYLLASESARPGEPVLTLGGLLREQPALSLEPVAAELLDIPVSRLQISVIEPSPEVPLYWPPHISLAAAPSPASPAPGARAIATPASVAVVAATDGYPTELTERHAVVLAHDTDITRAASYLDSGLSVLISCEKLLVEHLAKEIAGRAGRQPKFVDAAGIGGGGRRLELLSVLQRLVRDAHPDDVVVIPHLDLLASDTHLTLSGEARELVDVLYERTECILLAFTDLSLSIPEVLASRFAVQLEVDVLPREIVAGSGRRVPVGQALVLQAEADLFKGFDPVGIYKHIAGLNAVRLRHALQFAFHQHQGDANRVGGRRPTFRDLLDELRTFKAKNSRSFEVPNVEFDQIGGYDEVKAELVRALTILSGAADLPERLRPDLVPRGFILHGPPGTGKTLFAKAIASALNATILVVSGPEVTDMYHGESERKVRDLFAEARRNAPAVVVFDEFDSIAGRRGGYDDGGSRATNAVVAQLLTELDGFRPEVPVLIIGTTNRIDLIDDALLRPSRFKPIKVDLPDEQARREIAVVHARHFDIPVSGPLLDEIGRATDKLNGDEIRSIFRDTRADELVGPASPKATAWRLGEVLGTLRRAQQERETPMVHRGARGGAREAPPHMLLLSGETDPQPGPRTAAHGETGRGPDGAAHEMPETGHPEYTTDEALTAAAASAEGGGRPQ